MARRGPDATGQVVQRRRGDGTTFALRFRAGGRRQYVTLGSTEDGWTEKRAQRELAATLRDVDAGVWRPPSPAPAPITDPTFHEFASDWFAAKRGELRPHTAVGYQAFLTRHLLPFFQHHRLSQITVAEVDRYREGKVRESAARTKALEAWRERLEATADPDERAALRRQRPPKPLGAETVNKTLKVLGAILDVAEERELIARNPLRVNPRRRRLKVRRPAPVWLDRAPQIAALLDAAGRLDAEAREDRTHIGRRAILATLTYAGLRIGELCDLRWRDVELSNARLRVRQGKSDAAVRYVDLLPALLDELTDHRARFGGATRAPVFPTSTGGRMSERNVAQRVLEPAIELANQQLEDDGEALLPEGLTLHKLRHTACSLLFVCGYELPRVMAQLGHADAGTTLRVYAHTMAAGEGDREALRELVGGRNWAPIGHQSQVDALLGAPRRPDRA